MVYKLSHAERKFLKYVRSTDPLTQLRDCWEWHKDWYTKNGAQIGVFQWIHQGVCCFFFYFIIAATWSGVTGRESKVVTGSKVFVNTASAKVQWDAAAVASQYRSLPVDSFEGDDRDEYGHLTFAAHCEALETHGRDPEWPLRSPHDDTDGTAGLGFETAADLCASMASLPERLRVYTFPLSKTEAARYSLAKLAPTFNRGYDVEGHIVDNMQEPPFATSDPKEATAFLIPVRPYLDRVAAYPEQGRDAMVAAAERLVRRIQIEQPEAWEFSEPGCQRVMVSSHDAGTLVAKNTGDAVKNKAVVIASNADSTSLEDLEGTPAGEANKARDLYYSNSSAVDEDEMLGWHPCCESRFEPSKDVSAVCSLSYHLPRDAVAMRAVVPLSVGAPEGYERRTEDHRPITVSFRGNSRGSLRAKVFDEYRKLGREDWDLEAEGQVTPGAYMDLMANSKFCLHVRGTRVQSPRLIEVMMFGCVPVIIADGYDLPLSWLLDWDKFSIRLPEAEYARLPEVIANTDWRAMHDNLRRVLGFFVYHKKPILGDAFWATMLGVERQIKRGRQCGGPQPGAGKKGVTKVTKAAGEAWKWVTG